MSAQSEFLALSLRGERATLATVVRVPEGAPAGVRVGLRMLVRLEGGVDGTLGDAAIDDAARAQAEAAMWTEHSELREVAGVGVFMDVSAPPPRLIVFGAVDYAAALCRTASATGWRSYVVDPRGRFATAERFPHADEVIAAWPAQAIERLGGIDRATYLAILTHDPKLDDAALLVALESDAPYIGAMGSRRAQAARRERLLEAGVDEAVLERIAAPIGLDIGALGAEETALSIMAEVVAVRNGRPGGRLAATKGRIHQSA